MSTLEKLSKSYLSLISDCIKVFKTHSYIKKFYIKFALNVLELESDEQYTRGFIIKELENILEKSREQLRLLKEHIDLDLDQGYLGYNLEDLKRFYSYEHCLDDTGGFSDKLLNILLKCGVHSKGTGPSHIHTIYVYGNLNREEFLRKLNESLQNETYNHLVNIMEYHQEIARYIYTDD